MNKVLKYLRGDRTIWIIVMIFTLISILVVFTSVGSMAYKFNGGNTGYYLRRHTIFLFLGLFVIFVTSRIKYSYFSRLSVLLIFLSAILLVVTLLFGKDVNDANRTLVFFQTSDLAKLALIMYIARVLSRNQDNIKDYKKVAVHLTFWILIICGLILPSNLSTAALLFISAATLMFIGRVNIFQLALVNIIAVVVLAVFMFVAAQFTDKIRDTTWRARLERFWSDEETPESFQSSLSKTAVATGGIFGKGPGHSEQRYYLPHPYSDFIYAIIVEEYGFVGAIVVLLLYLILFYRAGIIVKKSSTSFGALLAIGLAISLVYQALINMGVCVGVLPVTGQPLPFISWGGTSIFFTSISIGAILSVSSSFSKTKVNEQ